jgi:hypothetical protein
VAQLIHIKKTVPYTDMAVHCHGVFLLMSNEHVSAVILYVILQEKLLQLVRLLV